MAVAVGHAQTTVGELTVTPEITDRVGVSDEVTTVMSTSITYNSTGLTAEEKQFLEESLRRTADAFRRSHTKKE